MVTDHNDVAMACHVRNAASEQSGFLALAGVEITRRDSASCSSSSIPLRIEATGIWGTEHSASLPSRAQFFNVDICGSVMGPIGARVGRRGDLSLAHWQVRRWK